MLTSKDILERTGISRATLNNYIAGGLVARPDVLPPGPDDGAAPRIGYFPDDTIERIETIQRLKREGWSIARIVEYLAGGGAVGSPAAAPVVAPPPAPVPMPPSALAPDSVLPTSRRRQPILAPVAVLVATLEDAAGLWTRLPAQDYFELVDEVWAELDAIFRGHGGTHARHPDEGMATCFHASRDVRYLWSALAAARDAREAMRRVSVRWQERKAWGRALWMNSGIDAGECWVGEIARGDLRVLGEAAMRAEQLSRAGRGGAVLATRDLLDRLAPHERQRVAFGTPMAASVPSLYSPLAEFAPPAGPAASAGLGQLAVAQVLEVRDDPINAAATPPARKQSA